jgi:hypothetical protein
MSHNNFFSWTFLAKEVLILCLDFNCPFVNTIEGIENYIQLKVLDKNSFKDEFISLKGTETINFTIAE